MRAASVSEEKVLVLRGKPLTSQGRAPRWLAFARMRLTREFGEHRSCDGLNDGSCGRFMRKVHAQSSCGAQRFAMQITPRLLDHEFQILKR